jgi:hypothetical protein
MMVTVAASRCGRGPWAVGVGGQRSALGAPSQRSFPDQPAGLLYCSTNRGQVWLPQASVHTIRWHHVLDYTGKIHPF